MALPTLQGALKDGFVEAVMACDMPKPCRFLSLDWCQKRFLWTHKEVDLPPHPLVGLVLQVGDAEKFPHALGFEGLDPFFRMSKQGPCFIANEEDGGDERLVQLEPAVKLIELHHQIRFSMAITVIAEAAIPQYLLQNISKAAVCML